MHVETISRVGSTVLNPVENFMPFLKVFYSPQKIFALKVQLREKSYINKKNLGSPNFEKLF
jgi:hypothetical protein